MSEHLPTNENLDDRLQAVLQDGSVRALLRRVDGLDNRDTLREAVQFCEQHMTDSNQVTSIYVATGEGRVKSLDEVESLSLSDVETVGYEDDGSLYLHLKGLE
jgi:hypothetical protein